MTVYGQSVVKDADLIAEGSLREIIVAIENGCHHLWKCRDNVPAHGQRRSLGQWVSWSCAPGVPPGVAHLKLCLNVPRGTSGNTGYFGTIWGECTNYFAGIACGVPPGTAPEYSRLNAHTANSVRLWTRSLLKMRFRYTLIVPSDRCRS